MNKGNRMTITEYFARMCAAGLMPTSQECNEILAVYGRFGWALRFGDGKNYYIPIELSPIAKCNVIQLRKDGVNLYELEWRKPTEQDVGKMCWHLNNNVISLAEIKSIKHYTYDKSPKELNDE